MTGRKERERGRRALVVVLVIATGCSAIAALPLGLAAPFGLATGALLIVAVVLVFSAARRP